MKDWLFPIEKGQLPGGTSFLWGVWGVFIFFYSFMSHFNNYSFYHVPQYFVDFPLGHPWYRWKIDKSFIFVSWHLEDKERFCHKNFLFSFIRCPSPTMGIHRNIHDIPHVPFTVETCPGKPSKNEKYLLKCRLSSNSWPFIILVIWHKRAKFWQKSVSLWCAQYQKGLWC